MDPENNLQDVLRCHLCETPIPPLHCDICDKHLCKACVGDHLLDESTEHKVVPFKKRGRNPQCSKHTTKLCDIYCKQCKIPFCLECVSSGLHLSHKQVGILQILETQREILNKYLKELEKYIYPKYQEIESYILHLKANLNKNSQKLTAAIDKHGEDMHKEIDHEIKKLKFGLDEMNSKCLALLNKHEDEIRHTLSQITKSIAELNVLLRSNNVGQISAYKSRNSEFRSLPPKLIVDLPIFTSQKINKARFGSLSELILRQEKNGYTIDFPPYRPLVDEPQIIKDIIISNIGLRSVSCLSDKEIWTCAHTNKIMRLYNLQGEVLKSIKTLSGNRPFDIAVSISGDLIYTDLDESTVNKVKNRQTQTLIRLQGWRPLGVCRTFSDDLLIIMVSDYLEQTKVVRYSGYTEKQTIQYNDKGIPLYSSTNSYKYISENKNLDICVADSHAHAVVVVNQAGKVRFIYTGPPSNTKASFYPAGITTDSQSRILTADCDNNCIHILDQDGQFLRYIENDALQLPFALCVDTRDNLFVTEWDTSKVKIIQYCK